MERIRWCEVCGGVRRYQWVWDEHDPDRDPPVREIASWPLVWRCPVCSNRLTEERHDGVAREPSIEAESPDEMLLRMEAENAALLAECLARMGSLARYCLRLIRLVIVVALVVMIVAYFR